MAINQDIITQKTTRKVPLTKPEHNYTQLTTGVETAAEKRLKN